ncbi:hypothetical protein [Chitinophaga nivalis]|uniref:DUF4270 domain-containing protein n=1 Tax=Chitinophaga nivalis TaxID=2991709 RepID=A0ABT3IJV8_9BACT|nr:hypothetical protein [Chitinophaga nivalis]MCW3466072.1 hypothetical protein [Chitinophaga nivalis]MCW3484237.1 hypothetical protein [Chitinophaga nivalis]
MKNKIMYLFFILPASWLLLGCYKYKERDPVENPAYMRVFNSVAVTPDVLQGGGVSSFFTFLMDPETDGEGIPLNAATMCDFLTTRQLFSTSYPINAGNSSEGHYVIDQYNRKVFSTTPVNFEYPGNKHVLTAPVINGFDLSAWAQIPAGKHRIVFVNRPRNSIPFSSLSKAIRNQVLVDTVVDFTKDEVYTLQILSRDLDKNKFGLYVRKEQFIHQAFEKDKIYVGFINLSGVLPKLAELFFMASFPEKVSVKYSYKMQERSGVYTYVPLPGYNNNYYTTLTGKMDTVINYMTLPLLPREYFFDKDTLRTYDNLLPGGRRLPPTLPFAEYTFGDADRPGKVTTIVQYTANPAVYNTYRYESFLNAPSQLSNINVAPNLNLITSSGNRYHISATLNIMEIVYDRIYMMQVQRGFNEIPQ